MKQSEQIDQLAAALAAFQGEVDAIPKNDSNPFFKSKYAALPDVVKVAAPLAAKHGLAISQTVGMLLTNDGCFDALTTTVMHASGQWQSDTARLHLTKDDSQGHGSAVTYMRRYAYMAALGLVADVDDDGNAASKHTPREESTGVRGYIDKHPANTTRKRPPPNAAVENGKRAIQDQLLAICQGDKMLARKLWVESGLDGRAVPITRTEIDLLMSRAQAEVDKEPEPAS